MSLRIGRLANLVGGSLFLTGVCVILPLILFGYVSAAAVNPTLLG